MFLYKYKKKCLPLLKTAVFQDYICSRTIRLGPNSSAQKSKRSHPGTQILSQISEDGEGNRGQMLHICPGSPPPPLGLNIDRCIILKTEKHSINCFTYLKIGSINSRCSGNEPALLPRTLFSGRETGHERAAEIEPNLKSAQYKICKAKYEYFEIKYLYLFYIYFFYLFDFFHYYYYIPLPV